MNALPNKRRFQALVYRLPVPFLAFLLVGSMTWAQDEKVLIENLAGAIEANVAKLGGNVVIVPPMPYPDGIKSIEGALIAEHLAARLSEGGVVRVVERAMLDKIMAEQKLSASGFVDPASSVKIGKLLGAKGILSGSVTDLGEKIEVNARLINVESGEVVVTNKGTAPKTIKTFISPLWSQIDKIKKDNPSFALKIWTDKEDEPTAIPGCRIGDFLTLHFQADRDCYVTIFDFTTSGSVHVLFPNAFMKDNHVKGGRAYTFPDPQAGFKIRVKDPPGIERLKAFATTKKIDLFEQDFSVEKFRSVTTETYSVTRDLEAVLDSLDDNAWAEAGIEVRIEQLTR
jgi:hypothetical protein